MSFSVLKFPKLLNLITSYERKILYPGKKIVECKLYRREKNCIIFDKSNINGGFFESVNLKTVYST